MEFSTIGFVYRTAYFFKKSNRPTHTNLCRLFWRFLIHLLLVPAYIVLAIPALLVFRYVICYPLTAIVGAFAIVGAWMFGYCPNWRATGSEPLFKPIRFWRKGWQYKPAVYLGAVISIFLLWKMVMWLFSNAALIIEGNSRETHPLAVLILFGVCVAVAGAVIVGTLEIAPKLLKSDPLKIAREYFKAKKQKVCPLVTFVDPNDPQPLPATN